MADKKFKQIVLNELTLMPLCSDETEVHNRVSQYARTLVSGKKS